MKRTMLDDAVMRSDVAWKIQTESGSFWPSSVSVPVRSSVTPPALYTPPTRVFPPRVPGHDGCRCPSCGVVIRDDQVALGLQCDGVRRVDRPAHRSGREPGHGPTPAGPPAPGGGRRAGG